MGQLSLAHGRIDSRIVLILQENELWDIMNSTTANPVRVPTVAVDKVVFDMKYIKAK